jgi:hypothetical protein
MTGICSYLKAELPEIDDIVDLAVNDDKGIIAVRVVAWHDEDDNVDVDVYPGSETRQIVTVPLADLRPTRPSAADNEDDVNDVERFLPRFHNEWDDDEEDELLSA